MTDSTSGSQQNTDYVGDPVESGQDQLANTPEPVEDPRDAQDVREGRSADPNLSDVPADEQPHPGSSDA